MSKEKESFGETIRVARQERNWTVSQFIDRLKRKGQKKVSPAYVTRIEQYGEIPSPEFICIVADVLNLDAKELLDRAKTIKVQAFDRKIEEKYQAAAGHYRVQRSNEREEHG